MTKPSITAKAQTVLDAIASGNTTREDIADSLNVSLPVVNGSLTSLKRNGLIEVDEDGILSLTADAADYVTSSLSGLSHGVLHGHRAGTKMATAAALFDKLYSKGRQTVLEAFQDKVGLTKAGASTYYQTLRAQSGMAQGIAFSKARKAADRAKAASKTKRA